MFDDPNSRVDREVRDALEALAKFLTQHGATVKETARPQIDFPRRTKSMSVCFARRRHVHRPSRLSSAIYVPRVTSIATIRVTSRE
jgi:hypothetical protein